jgi:predicted DCC family thiol-disulfide oxidoreductase YuxK
MKMIDSPILIYDGICVLCNFFLDIIIKADKNKSLKYLPLQDEKAQLLINSANLEKIDTVVYYSPNKQFYIKSEAVIQVLTDIGGIWKMTSVFKFIPLFIRDYIYDFIARNRYGWFGKRKSCRLVPGNDI